MIASLSSPIFASGWAAFEEEEDEQSNVYQGGTMKMMTSIISKPVVLATTANTISPRAFDTNPKCKELQGQAPTVRRITSSSIPTAPFPCGGMTTTTMMITDGNKDEKVKDCLEESEDYDEEDEDDEDEITIADDGISAVDEGREMGEGIIRRIERRQLQLGRKTVRSPPLDTTTTSFSSTATSSVPAAAEANTTTDTAAAVAPPPTTTTTFNAIATSSRSMRVGGAIIKGSLTKKKKTNIRGLSNSSSHSGSSGIFPSGIREQHHQQQQQQQQSNAATATYHGRGGRTSPIIVDANFNTAAALSAVTKSNNNAGIIKIKNSGKRRSVGPSQRIKLGRNKNKDSNNAGDAAVVDAAPPPLLLSHADADKGAPTASITPKMTSPAPHLYAEIIVPAKRRRPSRHQLSAGCVAPAATTTTDTDKAESKENGDDVSLAFTSVSSMTGRSSIFGPSTGGISNRSGGENTNNGIMTPPYQNLLSSILWCPFGVETNDTGGGDRTGTVKEVEVEDYFNYSEMQDNGAGGVKDGDIGKKDADEDGGGGMITKLLGVWNETFNSTCQCFESMGDGDIVERGGVSSLGKGVDDSNCSKTNDVGSQLAAKPSGKSIVSGEKTTANDTTASMISKKSSHHSLQKVPTFSEPLEG